MDHQRENMKTFKSSTVALMLALITAATVWTGCESDKDQAKDAAKDAGHDVKNAAQDTGSAIKHGAKSTKDAVTPDQ